ncbi:MAG TPA: phosphohistidine phosphatase SixA [Thermoanaerobaculia bacterium]|jgi:phosphohistidine phosphatase|nr:phosphohistidine phosphatase SixA [Thermoanaerobaculia bacterium]
MELWLLRHAAAEDRAASGRDQDRELTPEGARRARAVARGLAALDPGIDLVITSPYRRAWQTAKPVVEALGLEKAFRDSAALEPDRDPEEILAEVAAEEKSDGILLVGHQPHLGILLGQLLAGSRGPEIPLKKASLARVELAGRGRGQLRALFPAPVLEQIARARG